MIADLPVLPALTVASDGHEPSLRVAAARLRAVGARLVRTQPDVQALPFADATFDLVISRHPIETWWNEIARVLEPGGSYLSLQIGSHSLRDPPGCLPDHLLQVPHRRKEGRGQAIIATVSA